MSARDDHLLVNVATAPASDSRGFVGVVSVGEAQAYRTIRAHPTPPEAAAAAQGLLCDALGTLMAGAEWQRAHEELGHAPRRTELEFGLGARSTSDK